MSNSSSKAYKFQIVNGTVTAVYKIENGRIQNDGMDHDESWSLDGGNVVKTQWDDGRLETTTYSDANGDGIFFAVSGSSAVRLRRIVINGCNSAVRISSRLLSCGLGKPVKGVQVLSCGTV